MTSIALPFPRRKRSKASRAAKSAAKAWASLHVADTASKTAKKGAKWWASFKVVETVGKGGKKLLLIPIAAGGGLVAYKKVRGGSDAPATPYGSSMGHVATPATVTPPKNAPGTNGDAAPTDAPATPPGATS
jgi:hypothetical protein